MEKSNCKICAIVAVGPNDVIGFNGGMPWHSKQDFYHFKKMTIGFPCIFGKTTFFNMPKHPLPKRPNIVCSSSYKNEFNGGFFCASSLESALQYCVAYDRVFVCGGGALYKYALDKDLIDVMYLTRINSDGLQEQIAKNSDLYIRFPFNTTEFFDNPRWVSEQIIYPVDTMPVENSGVTASFFKYSRNR